MPPGVSPSARLRGPRWHAWAIAGVVAVAATLARLWAFAAFGADIPQWDSWNATGEAIVVRAAAGEFGWRNFFEHHNEHLIPWTRLVDLVLFRVSGAWDPVASVFAAAAVFGACAGVLQACLQDRIAGVPRAAVAVIALAWTGLPVSSENLLSGFQISIGFTVLGGALLLAAAVEERRWRSIALAIAGTVIGLGSTLVFVAPAAAVVVAAAGRLLQGGRRAAVQAGVLALGGVGSAVLLWVTRGHVPGAEAMAPRTVEQFAFAVSASLGWPMGSAAAPWSAAILVVPSALLVFRLATRRTPVTPAVVAWAFLVTWSVVMAVAIGVGRGAQIVPGVNPSPRYAELLFAGTIGHAIAAFVLLREAGLGRVLRCVFGAWAAVVAVAWLGAQVVGVGSGLAVAARGNAEQRFAVQRLLVGAAGPGPSAEEIRFPSPEWVGALLRRDEVRSALVGPAGARYGAPWEGPAGGPGFAVMVDNRRRPMVVWSNRVEGRGAVAGAWTQAFDLPAERLRAVWYQGGPSEVVRIDYTAPGVAPVVLNAGARPGTWLEFVLRNVPAGATLRWTVERPDGVAALGPWEPYTRAAMGFRVLVANAAGLLAVAIAVLGALLTIGSGRVAADRGERA